LAIASTSDDRKICQEKQDTADIACVHTGPDPTATAKSLYTIFCLMNRTNHILNLDESPLPLDTALEVVCLG
jgi:hypothetical protein